MDGLWTAACGQQKPSNDPGNNQHNPQYANYWAPLTRKRHIPPHPAQPRDASLVLPKTSKLTPAEEVDAFYHAITMRPEVNVYQVWRRRPRAHRPPGGRRGGGATSCLPHPPPPGRKGGGEHREAGYGRPLDSGVWAAKTHRYVAERGQRTQAYQCAGGHQSRTHLTLRPKLSPQRRQSPEPCRSSPTLTPFKAEGRDKNCKALSE